MTHYSATSLEQIADEFLRRAKDSNAASERTPTAKHKAYHRAQAVVWETAADLLRNTRLADPAMEEARADEWRKGYCAGAYRPDWKGPPTNDELDELWLREQERRALLAKDNGHAR